MSDQIRNLSGVSGGQVLMRFNGAPGGALGGVVRHNEGAAFLEGQLTDFETEIVEELYEPKDGLVLCPTDSDLDFGIKQSGFYMRNGSGRAGLVDGIDPDIPLASVGVVEVKDDAFTLALGYEVDVDSLMADRTGRGPAWDEVRELDALCSDGLWAVLDESIIEGMKSGKINIRSMFSGKQTGIGTYSLLGEGGGEVLRSTDGSIINLTADSTGKELADGLLFAIDQVYIRSKKAVRPNRLAVSLELRSLIQHKMVGDTGLSVLQYVVANSRYVESGDDIIGTDKLKGFFPAKGKNPARDAIIPYRYDRKYVRARIMPPKRQFIKEYPFGQMMVWASRIVPAGWRQPLGCMIFANDPAAQGV